MRDTSRSRIAPRMRGDGRGSVLSKRLRRATSFVAWLACLLATGRLLAQAPSPLGAEFQVNSYTTGRQYRPSVAMRPGDEFVVVWTSYGSNGTDVTGYSIQGQLYDSTGGAVGSQFQVNGYTTGQQQEPAIAMQPGGSFVVTWTSQGSGGTDLSGDSIQGRLFDSTGTPLGPDFQINTTTSNEQRLSSVAAESTGKFVVVWQSDLSGGTDSSSTSIQGQRFDATGNPVGAEFQINSYTTNGQFVPSVASDAAGDFVVAWYSEGSVGNDNLNTSIQGQRFDPNAVKVGTEFQANSFTQNKQFISCVASDSGGDFVVSWLSYGSSGTDSSATSVQGQRYVSSGSPVGSQFQVNTYTPSYQRRDRVAMDDDGHFVVVWASYGSSGSDAANYGIQGQLYDSTGSPVGAQFQVNTYTTGAQYWPSIAFGAIGDFVVAWQSNGSGGTDTSGYSVHAQRFRISPHVLFKDGFETGDTSRWSLTVP